jgi:putative thioredoxin
MARDPAELDEGPMKERYLSAAMDLERRDFDAALGSLLEVLQKDRYYDDDGARRAIVALFLLLGEQDPAVRKYRPAFNRSLY